MSVIFVNTDNTDHKNKLYTAQLAGEHAHAAEETMKKVVTKIVDKAPGFSTAKTGNPKGYSIRLKVAKVEQLPNETKCTVAGEIVRYPNTFSSTQKGGGEAMVTTGNPKGYSIRLKVAKVEQLPNETKCTVSGEIVRYPNTFSSTQKGGGEAMVTTGMSGSATATGKGKFAVIDCVEAIAESLVAKTIPVMRQDMLKR